MIGLDTNVLVRYIAQDDPQQSARADEIISALDSENPGFITLVTLVELVWVMQRCYRADKTEIATILDRLLRTREFIIENASTALRANDVFSRSNGDFSDCLIAQCAQLAGCETTLTFDKQAAKVAGMRLIA